MKDAENEAFDDLAKRQGDWGSGFQAKRAAAADKLEDESDMLTIAYLDGYEKGKRTVLAQPAQEPIARVTGMSFGRFIVEPLNPAMVLPVGMALYSLPQGNLYPCCALRTSDIHTCIPPEEEYD